MTDLGWDQKGAERKRKALESFEKFDYDTVINKNGRDNASCPNCGHYNALLHETFLPKGAKWGDGKVADGYLCRDCYATVRVVTRQEGT
jgi:hypothetical protein